MNKKALEIISEIEHKRYEWYWLYKQMPKQVYINKKMAKIIAEFYGRENLDNVCTLNVILDEKIKKVKDIWVR